MAQGQFTKEEAKATREAVTEIFEALSKSKRMDFLVHLNDIYLFIDRAERVAPNEGPKGETPAEFLARVGHKVPPTNDPYCQP